MGIIKRITLIPADLSDMASLLEAVTLSQPHEIYNLAAQSFVGSSFDQPLLTTDIDASGATRFLEIIRHWDKNIKFYQASTSELFGGSSEVPQNELTPMVPHSPYAAAKLHSYHMVKIYRQSYGLFACNGILFNHESPLRGLEFVTRKITNSVAKIKLGIQKDLRLGNMLAKRDWGYAPDFCINKDVPILTTDGWMFCDDINESQEIINFNADSNQLSRDKVKKKFVLPSDGDKIILRGRGVYLNVTPNHRIYYQSKSKNSKGGWSKWKVITALDFYDLLKKKSYRTRYDYRLPHFQDYSVENLEGVSNEQLYFMGVLLAEGHLHKSRRQNDGVEVSISQSFIANEYVFSKINAVINKLRLKYRMRERNDGVVEWIFNSESSKKILSWFDQPNVHIMPRSFYKLSSQQAEIVFKALMDCDGSWGEMLFTSKRYLLTTDFQSIAHLAGYRTTELKRRKNEDCYNVCAIVKRKKYAYIQQVEKTNDGVQEVWCVETKNGTIITRDKGCISISGNCRSMWMMMQHDTSDDYVVATGETHSVEEFADAAFNHVGLDWKDYVITDKRLHRPMDVHQLHGSPEKAAKVLKWKPKVTFKQLVQIMVDADIQRWEKYLEGKAFAWDAPNHSHEMDIISRNVVRDARKEAPKRKKSRLQKILKVINGQK